MEIEKKNNLINSLLNDVKTITYGDSNGLDKIIKRVIMIVKKIFGNDSDYLKQVNEINFIPQVWYGGMSQQDTYDSNKRSFNSGREELENLINVMKEDIDLSDPIQEKKKSSLNNQNFSNDIFVVHGHSEEMKQACARFLEKIKLNPIILHEKPNKSRTIIEKFSDYSNVSCAIILLSADDLAYPKSGSPQDAKYRARQNVILELGFFLGKLGRERVLTLHDDKEEIEIPSDYDGVIYIRYNSNNDWKNSVTKELKSLGYNFDANSIP